MNNNFIYDTVSIKLVIPSLCNANCSFCYGLGFKCKKIVDFKPLFLERFIPSLKTIIEKVGDLDISLDITGGEPTMDTEFIIKVLKILKESNLKSKFKRITFTTNGLNLEKIIIFMKDLVDYVNISIHSYNWEERNSIFKIKTFTDDEYYKLASKLLENNIVPSAVAIIYKQIPNYTDFINNFINWCKSNNFKELRFRKDVYWNDKNNYFDSFSACL